MVIGNSRFVNRKWLRNGDVIFAILASDWINVFAVYRECRDLVGYFDNKSIATFICYDLKQVKSQI